MVRGLKADYYHVLGTWLIKIQIPKKVADGPSRDDGSAAVSGKILLSSLSKPMISG
jgi:hypothetical protein